jgi:hypothetical protein
MAVIVKRRNVAAVPVETNKGDSMAGFDPTTGQPIPDPPALQNQPLPSQGVTIQMPPQVTPPSNVLTPELQALFDAERERVRKEEKDKLYETMEQQRLQGEAQAAQLATLTQEREERLQVEAAAQAQAAQEEEARRQAEMTALERMQEIERNADARLRETEEALERERILRQREMELSSIMQYRAGRLAEESENIMPQFVDFVRGNTQEEIESSIADVKTRTAAIVAEVQQTQVSNRQQLTMPVSGAPMVTQETLVGADQQVTYSNEDLRNMTNEEYAQIRPQLQGAVSRAVAERGIYGA